MSDFLELQEFFVEGRDQRKSHVLLHITEPSEHDKKTKGHFFAVTEINNGTVEQIEYLQQMIDDIEAGYYETPDTPEKNALETTLEYINRRGHHLLQYSQVEIHCIVGVIHNFQIFFSSYGSPVAHVFYKTSSGYESLSVIETSEDPHEQFFSNLNQGSIKNSEFFYITTPHVSKIFPPEKLIPLAGEKNTIELANTIQEFLQKEKSQFSYGGIFFQRISRQSEFVPKTHPSSAGSAASLDSLIARTKDTEETLSPPLFGNTKKVFEQIVNLQEKFSPHSKNDLNEPHTSSRLSRQRKHESISPWWKELLITLVKGIILAATTLLSFGQKILVWLSRGISNLFILITNRHGQRHVIINSLKTSYKDKKQVLLDLPLLSKILLGSAFLFVIIFISSIGILRWRENVEQIAKQKEEILASIQNKKNTADASLIYGDNQKALTLLQEAKQAADSLAGKSEKDKQLKTDLQNSIELLFQKVRKMETVKPTLVQEFPAAMKKMALVDNTLVVFDKDNPLSYVYDLGLKQMQSKTHETAVNIISASTPKEQDKIIFGVSPDGVAEFNKTTQTIIRKDISFPVESVNLADAQIYNRRLYTLDTAHNQIYKHSPTQTGYDKGTTWIKEENIDLQEPISLAIDGDMYLLRKNGTVLKFSGGRPYAFSLEGIDPALESPQEIWTYNGVSHVYILEAKQKRVIVTDKEGGLVVQYTANEWQNPTSMVVNEDKGIIYILDGTKVFTFEMKK